MDKLKEKSRNANTNAMISQTERMNLFDSTKADKMETKGTSSLKSLAPTEGGFMISGRNVGAEENEPDWTEEQMKFIRSMTTTTLQIVPVKDTRRSVMDPDQKFVGRDENGSIVPTEEAYVSSLDPSHYCVGTGPMKYDTTGSPRFYSDAVVADINGQWLVNQWTSEWVVIEGVAPNVLMQQHKTGSATQSGRRIGYNFARIGLPKSSFGALFNTLAINHPGSMSSITETRGYYWTNASWGVASFSGTFAYMEDGKLQRTTNLVDVMRMLNGRSSLCLATVAISITCSAKAEREKMVPNTDSYGLSIKLHNAFGVNTVDFHGPPQQGSTGMMIPKRFVEGAQSMSKGGVMRSSMGNSSSIFASKNQGLFGASVAAPPTIRSDDNASFM